MINRKWEEVTGLTREVVIGNTDESLFPGPNGKRFRANDLEVIESGRVIEKEEILAGEAMRYFISIKFPLRDEHGNVKGICGMSTEITERKQVEAALQESETIFSSFLEHSPVYVFFKDKNIRTLRLSKNYEQMLGVPINEALGKTMDELFPSDLAKSMVADDLRILNEGQRVDVVEELNGRIYETTKFPIFKDGQPFMLAGFTVDITERKQAEVALRESEAIFSSFLEHCPIYVFFMDKNIRILRMSKNYQQLLGAPISEMLGKTMDELYPIDAANKMIADDLQVFNSGLQINIVEEITGRIYETTKFPVFKDGKPDMLIGIAIDITERKHAEKALRESEENYRILVELSPDAIIVHSNGKVVFANSSAATLSHATDVSELLGLPVLNFVHPDMRAMISAQIKGMQDVGDAGAKVAPVEEKFISLDGTIIDVEVVAMPIHYEGRPAIQVVARDITERKQSEENLRESEERFRQIIEASPMGIHMYQLQGERLVFTGANPAADQILGVDNSQFIGKAIEEAFPPLAETEVPDRYRHAASKGIPWEMVQVDYDHGGIHGAYETHAFQTGPGRMAVMFLDITERKKAQADLEMSEKRNRAIVAALPDLLFEISADGRFLDCMASDPSRLFMSREQAIGRRLDDFWPLEWAALTMEKTQQTLADGAMQVFDYSLKNHQTTEYYESRITPLGSDSVLALVRDITESKQIEQALRHSELRYRTLFEQANDAIFVETLADQILDVNQHACQMLGYTREELLTMRVSDLIAPETHRKSQVVQQELSEFGRKPFESLDVRKDGEHFPVEVTNSILPDGLALSIVRDITERKRVEDALRKSETEVRNLNIDLEHRVAERTIQLEITNKELEAFSYSVSHDLRAPLRAIDGFSRIILEDHASQLNGEVQKLFERISVESRHMTQIIDALLNLSRMSRTEMRRETVDLSSLAHQVLDRLRLTQPQRQVECVIAKDIIVQGDTRLLYIVLENLLGNAWKFTSKRGQAHIEFGLVKRENRPVYFVRDNGAGFDPAYAEKLFGAFQRMHRSDDFEGTGIGLATVQRIVSRHGGRVWAEAEVNKGATFFFTLGLVKHKNRMPKN